MGMLALALDFEGRHGDAERSYRKALAIAPDSLFLLNNLGRHYVAEKRFGEARQVLLKALAHDPSNAFTLLELARAGVEAGDGKAALGYLDRVPRQTAEQPEAVLLRARALHLSGDDAAASALLSKSDPAGPGRASFYFSAGLLLAEWRHYGEAEEVFSRALEADPSSFNIEYNLGLASAEAGDLKRAREIFEHVLVRHPDDADSMLQLARVYQLQGDYDHGLPILMRASTLVPKRADILRGVAEATEKLGMYADTAQAWDRYLQLQPDDDSARRERGFALASADDLDKGLVDLRWFVERHPRDADGLYELAVAEAIGRPDEALTHFDLAIQYKPDFLAARYARASLDYQHGKAEQARADLEYMLGKAPGDSRALDLLGLIELRANRPEQAIAAYQRALRAAPGNAPLLLHYSQALQKANRDADARRVAAEYRATRSHGEERPADAGLFQFYQESPAVQRTRYIASLRAQIALTPGVASLHLALGEALLGDTRLGDAGGRGAVDELRKASALSGDPAVQARCGRDLIKAGQAGAAAEFLRTAAAVKSPADDLLYDLAVADFHASGAATALAALDRIAGAKRNAEYYLLRAEILDAARRPDDAVAALARSRLAPCPEGAGPDFYLEWSAMLLIHDKRADALDVLRLARKGSIRQRDLLLGEAVIESLEGNFTAGKRIVDKLESEWPEWGRMRVVKGAMLANSGDAPGALKALKIATTMSPALAGPACYVAAALLHQDPARKDDVIAAAPVLAGAEPDNPFCRLLAATADYSGGRYAKALDELTAAVAAHPLWKEGHVAMRNIYRAMGRQSDAAREDAAAAKARGTAVPVAGGAWAAAGLMGVKLRIPSAVVAAL